MRRQRCFFTLQVVCRRVDLVMTAGVFLYLPDALWKDRQLILWLDIIKKWTGIHFLMIFFQWKNEKMCWAAFFQKRCRSGSLELSGPTVGWNQETSPLVLDLIPFFGLCASYVAQCWRQPRSNLSNLLIPLIITQPLFHSLVIPPETIATHIERNQRMTCSQDKRKTASGGVKTNWTRFCLKMLKHVTQHETDCLLLF